ncbi:M48 family metallopeptidase [Agrobacterium rosae]|uniref:Peptidase n=1 Tax=Agrobacterium rosae TaxID=1972867 RepID=A0AAE5RZB7_9HYPH|nr:M48 family metallopeptidase [Agrobacterium rosae]KAA3512133.1 M48 family peptidase [Agrobacterium rosae]KAA3520419.1 M48 family peptidase [Agrobacterium rosae]MCM2432313.1 M48 family metallopeptidase [Agrobacterium rosae]MDX8331322.1 M48 family metallopeptidase [Agrobacterium rosae]MQB48732.1 M48 family peptidase [Agrobacterium rosae]
MNFDISKVRHSKEKTYGFLTLLIGTLVWLGLAAGILYIATTESIGILFVFLFYILIIWFFSYVARSLVRAYMMGHYVLVSEQQFPHLHKMVAEGAQKLGLKEAPRAFVYNSSGVINAMALTLVGRTRYIWLTSALIDSDDEEQVRFVIGHELGHHVAGHLDEPWSFLRLPGLIVPFLGQAYSRARELTCDRVGLVVSGNLKSSRTALQMLACGSAKLNAQMNPNAFEEQDKMVPSIAGFFLNIFSLYPRHTRRVAALSEWKNALSGIPSAPSRTVQTGRVEPQIA